MKRKILKVLEVIRVINRPFWTMVALVSNIGCGITWLRSGCSVWSMLLGCAWFTMFSLGLGAYIQDQTEEIIYELKRNMYNGRIN